MVNDVWKRIGIILSALWLLVAGCFEGLVICFVSLFYGLWALSLSILAYIVFGLVGWSCFSGHQCCLAFTSFLVDCQKFHTAPIEIAVQIELDD